MRFTKISACARLKLLEGRSASKYCGCCLDAEVPEVKMNVGTEMGGMGMGERGERWIFGFAISSIGTFDNVYIADIRMKRYDIMKRARSG